MNTTAITKRTLWNVIFSDSYATITTTVPAIEADDAVVLAENLIRDYYDIDVSRWSVDADDTTYPADEATA